MSLMLGNILTAFLGVIAFLFLFWRRLKEDYASSIVFTSAFYILGALAIGWLLAVRFFPAWYFWASALASGVGFGLGIVKFKMRFYETFEALVIGIFPWLSFSYLLDSVQNKSLISFLAFIFGLVLIYVFYFFDNHFREFTWYASGKVGFAGLSTLGLMFLIRAATSIFGVDVLSFVDNFKVEAALSLIAASLCFTILFNLARKVE